MKWIDIAFAAVFVTNVVFTIGAALALYKILKLSKSTRDQLLASIGESLGASKDLHIASRRIQNELGRLPDATAQESATGRALVTVNRQIAALQDLLHERLAAPKAADTDAQHEHEQAVTQRLRDKLREVLEKNMKLQQEIDMAALKLRNASRSNDELIDGLQDMKGVHPQYVKQLGQRTEMLKMELSMANGRAAAAEKLASENAERLLELQSAFNAKSFAHSASDSVQLDALRQQNEAMANRECELLAMLDAVKGELQRNLTEKSFIEDRFIEMDTQIVEV